MARLFGITLPEKRLPYALAAIRGIGVPLAQRILALAKVDATKKVSQLSTQELEEIRQVCEKLAIKVEGALTAEVTANIRHLKEFGTWRGLRHARNLPVRGQQTRTNARSKRGKKVTLATARKIAHEKT